jgi:Zn-dependent protease with chaperone function
MNDLGIALFWLLVQVTAVALAGLGVSALAGRRTPAAGASAALAALAATIVLALIACCPLPSWWTWEATIAPPEPAVARDGPAAPADDAPVEGGIRVSALLAALRDLGRAPASTGVARPVPLAWPAILTALAAAAAALGLARLLLGLWAVRQAWRRSRPVHAPELLHLVEELRSALGVRRPVAVRETTDLATAATLGWRRPVLLLSTDWRGWSAQQRRAVLAHELAHVRRGDFAAWLLARLSVALYCWHPLVHALAGRLHLQQELAADAAAARVAGGKTLLRTLAELALRADGRAHGWPAPAFLSSKVIFLRRIAMLQVTEDTPHPPAPQSGRRLACALLVGLTLLASAWRFPVREALAWPPAAEAVAPFDLTLLAQPKGKAQDGVFGLRVAALVSRPGAKPLLDLANAQLDALTKVAKLGGLGIHLEEVDHVLGWVSIGGENKPGKRSLMLSMNVIRMTHDMDWVKLRDRFGPLMKQHHYRGETYVSFTVPDMLKGIAGPQGEGNLWAADARTLVFDSDISIKAQIDARADGTKLPVPEYAAGWDKMSRGLFAMAIDNRDQRLVKRSVTAAEMKELLADPTAPAYHATRFAQGAAQVVIGVAGADDCRLDLRATAATPDAATGLVRHCEALVAAAGKATPDEDSTDAEAAIFAFMRKVVGQATVRRDGAVVTVHGEVGSGFNALISECVKEIPLDTK